MSVTTGTFTLIWPSFLFWDVTFPWRSVNDVKVDQQSHVSSLGERKIKKNNTQKSLYPYRLSGSEARLSVASSSPTNSANISSARLRHYRSFRGAAKKPIPLPRKDIKLDLCITSCSRMRISSLGYLSSRDEDGAMKVINVRGRDWESEWERDKEKEGWNWE